MTFIEKTTGAASFEIKGFTPKDGELVFPQVTALKSSFKRNMKKLWQSYFVGVLGIFVLAAVVTFLFPDSPKRLVLGLLGALLFSCVFFIVWFPLQQELFVKRGLNDFKFLISEDIDKYASTVQEWTRENGVEISDTTARGIITGFWDLDKPYNAKESAVRNNPSFLVIPFKDVNNVSYALVPFGKHYELMQTVVKP